MKDFESLNYLDRLYAHQRQVNAARSRNHTRLLAIIVCFMASFVIGLGAWVTFLGMLITIFKKSCPFSHVRELTYKAHMQESLHHHYHDFALAEHAVSHVAHEHVRRAAATCNESSSAVFASSVDAAYTTAASSYGSVGAAQITPPYAFSTLPIGVSVPISSVFVCF